MPCGFIHLPLLPAQVAERLERVAAGEPTASMAFPIQRRAVEVAIEMTVESRAKKRGAAAARQGAALARRKGRPRA